MEELKNVKLRGAAVKDRCQGSADIFTGARRPLFSSLFSFDGRLDLNFQALVEGAPALAVVLCDELVQTNISAAFFCGEFACFIGHRTDMFNPIQENGVVGVKSCFR